MSDRIRTQLEQLAARLEMLPAMASQDSVCVRKDMRHPFQTGYLQGGCLNAAEEIRKLLVTL